MTHEIITNPAPHFPIRNPKALHPTRVGRTDRQFLEMRSEYSGTFFALPISQPQEPAEGDPNIALGPCDRRRSDGCHRPCVPRRRRAPCSEDIFRDTRIERKGCAPVGSQLFHHGGGVLFPADRGVPSLADGERDAHPKGARHFGGPGRCGGRDPGPIEEETSRFGLPCIEYRLEAVLRENVRNGLSDWLHFYAFPLSGAGTPSTHSSAGRQAWM